jgi:transcriptional regulator with XRE-family HTH domain
VPREFWETDQMRDALATWHMGRVTFGYRMHPHHGRPLSQEQVGNWLGLTQAQLSRIENGRAPEELTKLIRYAQILGIPGDLLWFALPDQRESTSSERPRPASALMVSAIVNGRPVLLPIDAATAKAAGLDDLLAQLDPERTGKSGSGTARTLGLRTPNAFTSLGLDELEHVAAALNDASKYLDGSVVGYFAGQLGRCKADDGSLGPARALPLVLGILGAIQQHATEVKPGIRQALLALGADGAEFAGWLYRDLRDGPSAAYWYDRAMEWAQAANDTAMQGYVLLKKSQMAYEERDAVRVSTLAQAAQLGPWRLPATVRAEVTQQEALGLAMLGEPMSAVERKHDTARQLLADGARDELPGAYFTADTLQLRQAVCYTEAGKPALAVTLFTDVIASGALSRRDAGFFRARQAAALALSGQPDEAATVGLEAVQVAREMRSRRTIYVLADAVRSLDPWRSRPGPRALREAILS